MELLELLAQGWAAMLSYDRLSAVDHAIRQALELEHEPIIRDVLKEWLDLAERLQSERLERACYQPKLAVIKLLVRKGVLYENCPREEGWRFFLLNKEDYGILPSAFQAEHQRKGYISW